MIKVTTKEIEDWFHEMGEKKEAFFEVLVSNSEAQQRTEERWLSLLQSPCDENVIEGTRTTSLNATLLFRRWLTEKKGSSLALFPTPNTFTTHEAFVILYGLNLLALHLPNFPYFYGFEKLRFDGTSGFEKREDKRSWTGLTDKALETAKTFGQYVRTLSDVNEFVSLILQLCHSLKFARMLCGFTHYNLSATNGSLLVLPLKSKMRIRYQNVTLETKSLLLFSTFSHAHILVQNSDGRKISFGSLDPKSIRHGILRDRIFPIADIYKVLLSSLAELAEVNEKGPVFQEAKELFRYFCNEDIETVLEAQLRFSFTLPMTASTRGFNLEDFISFVEERNKRPPLSSTSVLFASPVLSFSPKTLVEFFDAYVFLLSSVEFSEDEGDEQKGEAKERLRAFTSNFIKGFSQGKSIFQAILKKTVCPPEKGLHALLEFVIQYRVLLYIISVYWKEPSKPPPEILKIMGWFEGTVSETVEEVAKRKIDRKGEKLWAALQDGIQGM